MTSKKNDGGYILVSVLAIILLLTTLTMSTVEATLQQVKMTSNHQFGHELFSFAENGARLVISQLEEKAMTHLIDSDVVGDIVEKDSTWWNANAETISAAETIIQYIIEEIAEDSCAMMGDDGQQPGVKYYRITTRASDAHGQYHTILQTTYAKAVRSNDPNCQIGQEGKQQAPRKVHAGVQSWHRVV